MRAPAAGPAASRVHWGLSGLQRRRVQAPAGTLERLAACCQQAALAAAPPNWAGHVPDAMSCPPAAWAVLSPWLPGGRPLSRVCAVQAAPARSAGWSPRCLTPAGNAGRRGGRDRCAPLGVSLLARSLAEALFPSCAAGVALCGERAELAEQPRCGASWSPPLLLPAASLFPFGLFASFRLAGACPALPTCVIDSQEALSDWQPASRWLGSAAAHCHRPPTLLARWATPLPPSLDAAAGNSQRAYLGAVQCSKGAQCYRRGCSVKCRKCQLWGSNRGDGWRSRGTLSGGRRHMRELAGAGKGPCVKSASAGVSRRAADAATE